MSMVENPTHKSYVNTYNKCKWLSLVAVAFTLLWCVWWNIQLFFTLKEPEMIQWKSGVEFVQMIILACYSLLPLALSVITAIFCLKLLKGLKDGEMFSLRCVAWIVAWGIVFGLADFIQDNVTMWGINGEFAVLTISPSCIVIPIFVFMFAALFRLAAKVSEDSNLAI